MEAVLLMKIGGNAPEKQASKKNLTPS